MKKINQFCKLKKAFSIITTLALIMQVVLPGALFNFDIQKAKAALPITITSPSTTDIWIVGNYHTITWTHSEAADYFELYYSEDYGANWISIDSNVIASSSPQSYGWKIPTVNGAGEDDFRIKIEGYLGASPGTPIETSEGIETRITTDGNNQIMSAISGDRIVWQDDRNDLGDIYMYDISTSTETRITNDINKQYAPAIYGDRIVWQDDRNDPGVTFDIYMYTISTTTETQITTNSYDQAEPTIYDDRIVWVDYRNSNWDIYMYDISTSTETQITTDSDDQLYSAIYGNRIVWHDNRNGLNDIYMYDISTSTETRITTDIYNQESPVIYNDRIVWHDGRNDAGDIYMYDISTSIETRITTDSNSQTYSAISDDRIVWQDDRDDPGSITDIYMYDISTSTETRITTDSNNQFISVISGDRIVWQDDRNDPGVSYDIYMTDLQAFTIKTPGGGPDPNIEKIPPNSKVIGISEDGSLISPMPDTIHQSEFTIVTEAEDESGIKQVELFWSQESTGDYQSYGTGTLTPISGTDYWTWDFDTENLGGSGRYYFYSVAIDNADTPNIETIPKSWWPAGAPYDATTLVSVVNPKIIITSPMHNETKVGVNADVRIVFDYAMDTASVEQAFRVIRTDGVTNNIVWTADWSNLDKTVVFSHIPNFSYDTEYEAWVDPSIAKSIYGEPLDSQSTKPNPWLFATALAQSPDLTTSTKKVNMDIAAAGDRLMYTIELKNIDTKSADVTFTDAIPVNTVYDNYVSNAKYDRVNNQIYWSGNLRQGRPRIIKFRVQILSPLPNGTVILNEAVFDDGINPSISKFAETIIQSPEAHITITSPMAGEQQVSIIPNIRIVFDQTMDRALVQQAFSVVRIDGEPNDIVWNAVWTDSDRTVSFTPVLGGTLEYLTEYEVYVDTLIAKTLKGAPLVSGAVPNPWRFKTTKELFPDITASYKVSSLNIVPAGDPITYTIYIKNTGDKIADVTFLDNIPYNTVYDNYVWNAVWDESNNRITWSGNLGIDQTHTISFRVRVDMPLPNGTIITNEALINDGINPEISRIAETIIQSPEAHITITSPMAGEQQVSIIPNIRIVFDQTMDRALVQQAFSVVRIDGEPNDIVWNAVWTDSDRTVSFTPVLGGTLEYLTEYEVYVDTLIAKTLKGAPLVSGAVPNPWRFKTTKELFPDITASYKVSSLNIVPAGDPITYTIYIKNTGDKIADVTFLDNIPYNTVYDNYVWNAVWDESNNRITWSGNLGIDQTHTISFRVRVDMPLPNGTIITNEALINDGINPEISRIAETIIQSPEAHITLTSPMAGEQQVSIIPNIRIVFDQTMDRALVQQAFSVVRIDGEPNDIVWNATWTDSDRTVSFTPALGGTLEYLTEYETYVDTLVAKTLKGAPLVSGAVPNPWRFKTVSARDPDLSTSEVIVDKDLAISGDFLIYTAHIRNTSLKTDADVSFTNPIPENTTYAHYVSGATYDIDSNSIIWTGIVKAKRIKTIMFLVQIDDPVPNGTIITDEATIDDGINEPLLRYAETLVKPEIDWETSYKEDENDNPNRPPHIAYPGDTLNYTVLVENTGSTEAINVFVNDLIPFRTTYVQGSATGGFVYDENKDQLSWFGNVPPNENKEFVFKVLISKLDNLFPPEDDTIINEAVILDVDDNFSVQSSTTVIIDEGEGGGPHPHNPYLIDVDPAVDETSVKLYTPITLTFSDIIIPSSLSYTVSVNDKEIDTSNWQIEQTEPSSVIIIRPNEPLASGTEYTIQITDAFDTQGQHLGQNGPIEDNTWSFTTVRPTLYFTNQAILNLKVGTVSELITVKLGDWINYDDPKAISPIYAPYQVEEEDGISVKLWSTSKTGRYDRAINGKFLNNSIDILMPYGQDAIIFYYTDSVVTFPIIYKMVTYAPYTDYLVYAGFRPVVTTIDGAMPGQNQIYFTTDTQSVPANRLSNPIRFEIRSPEGHIVPIDAGTTFLLSTSSTNGIFFNQFKLPLDQYAIYQTNGETRLYYLLSVPEDTLQATMYYQDSVPGPYVITVDEDYGINISNIIIANNGTTIPAGGANQTINILPLEDQDIDLEKELEIVEDDTGKKLAYLVINPKDVSVLPGGFTSFSTKGYEADGKEIKELVFGWYVIADGGSIAKTGTNTATFTAGYILGTYHNTVMVAAYYNGEIKYTTATVRITDIVGYGGPGQLPSTGPNGIQWLFIGLILISAVALAMVEHYEKTHFEESPGK